VLSPKYLFLLLYRSFLTILFSGVHRKGRLNNDLEELINCNPSPQAILFTCNFHYHHHWCEKLIPSKRSELCPWRPHNKQTQIQEGMSGWTDSYGSTRCSLIFCQKRLGKYRNQLQTNYWIKKRK
jgi:hypothetical protein